MLWLWFDTPSTKDFKKYISFFKKNDNKNLENIILKDIEKEDNDFLKLIVNDIWEVLGIMNKYNFNYLLLNKEDKIIINKLDKIIKIKRKK